MAQVNNEVNQVKQAQTVSIGKGIATILVLVIVLATVGTFVGKTFFWNNFKKVSKDDYVLISAQEAVKADPANPNKLASLGWAQYMKKDYETAINSYKQALKYDDNNFTAYLNLGVIYMNRKEYAKAEESLKKAIEIVPKSDQAHLNLGMFYILQKKYAEAQNELDLANKINPGSPDVLYNIGLTEEKLGHKDEALKVYQEAYSLDPKNKKPIEAINRLLGRKNN